jgi:carboxyl-terminal processing protease
MSSRTKFFVVSGSTCLTLLLLIGSVLGKPASPDDTLKHIGVFSDVVAHIKSEYVEEPDMKSVTLGALNGLLEAIDPFASYLNAEQYKEYLKTKDLKRANAG